MKYINGMKVGWVVSACMGRQQSLGTQARAVKISDAQKGTSKNWGIIVQAPFVLRHMVTKHAFVEGMLRFCPSPPHEVTTCD